VRFSIEDKQKLLEEVYPTRRLAMLCKLLNSELEILSIEKELNDATQEAMNKNQREYYLRE
jgi:ATP-dependent Lon protease